MQVILAHCPSSVFVPRKLIFPLKNPPKEMGTYEECKAAIEAVEASPLWANGVIGGNLNNLLNQQHPMGMTMGDQDQGLEVGFKSMFFVGMSTNFLQNYFSNV